MDLKRQKMISFRDGLLVLFGIAIVVLILGLTLDWFSPSSDKSDGDSGVTGGGDVTNGDILQALNKVTEDTDNAVVLASQAKDTANDNKLQLFSVQSQTETNQSAISTVDSKATQALSDASQAGTDATQALSDASQAGTDATQALSDASQAGTDATQALADASQAGTAAATAQSSATQALTTASQAISDSLTALSQSNKDYAFLWNNTSQTVSSTPIRVTFQKSELRGLTTSNSGIVLKPNKLYKIKANVLYQFTSSSRANFEVQEDKNNTNIGQLRLQNYRHDYSGTNQIQIPSLEIVYDTTGLSGTELIVKLVATSVVPSADIYVYDRIFSAEEI